MVRSFHVANEWIPSRPTVNGIFAGILPATVLLLLLPSLLHAELLLAYLILAGIPVIPKAHLFIPFSKLNAHCTASIGDKRRKLLLYLTSVRSQPKQHDQPTDITKPTFRQLSAHSAKFCVDWVSTLSNSTPQDGARSDLQPTLKRFLVSPQSSDS